jgi:molybdate transport system substrate-binding protein
MLRLLTRPIAALVVFLTLGMAPPAWAAEVTAAVAANFTEPAKEIAAAFKEKTGYSVDLSFGASGNLYTQITQGAPFDIFLSADSTRPEKAEKDGWGVAGTRFTYAIGKIVLWSADAGLVDKDGAVLKQGKFAHLAIANPKTAPYGAAAIEAMQALGVYQNLEPKIVTGENITQTYQFVVSGNAELGFVALSQLAGDTKGSRWLVPDNLYSPILQDAILLKVGEQNSFAKQFLDFLKSPDALKIIKRYGYDVSASK